MTFGVDPDTHIDTVEQAKQATIEGTSKWSCKLSITGTHKSNETETANIHFFLFILFRQHNNKNFFFCSGSRSEQEKPERNIFMTNNKSTK